VTNSLGELYSDFFLLFIPGRTISRFFSWGLLIRNGGSKTILWRKLIVLSCSYLLILLIIISSVTHLNAKCILFRTILLHFNYLLHSHSYVFPSIPCLSIPSRSTGVSSISSPFSTSVSAVIALSLLAPCPIPDEAILSAGSR